MFDRWMQISILSVTAAVLVMTTATAQSRRPAVNTGKVLENPDGMTNYWTDDRLNKADPEEAPSISQSELQELLMRDKAPLAPAPPIELPSRDVEVLGKLSEADVTQSPYKHAGRLYFTREGKDRSCSAQFVGDGTVVMTAAHCMQDRNTGAWATNVMFHRAYKSGGAPQQKVAAVCLSAKSGWGNGGPDRHRWDYSFLKMVQPSTSGWFGLKVGLPYASWEAIGYPKDSAGIMQKVSGSKGAGGAGVVQMVGNPMRKGNSGGAWHVSGTAIGLNSFHVDGNTTDEWSPLFDSDTIDLWKHALNGCKS